MSLCTGPFAPVMATFRSTKLRVSPSRSWNNLATSSCSFPSGTLLYCLMSASSFAIRPASRFLTFRALARLILTVSCGIGPISGCDTSGPRRPTLLRLAQLRHLEVRREHQRRLPPLRRADRAAEQPHGELVAGGGVEGEDA